MRRFMQAGSIAGAAVLLVCALALADDEAVKAPAGQTTAQERHGEQKAQTAWQEHKPELRRVSSLNHKKVITEDGNKHFGTIQDVIIDVDYGRMVYAVISHGGFLGIGDKNVLLPFATIRGTSDSKELRTTATVAQFKQAEGFDEKNDAQVRTLSDPAVAERFHKQYGVRPYWEEEGHSMRIRGEKTSSGEKEATEQSRESAQEGREASASVERENARSASEATRDRPGDRFRKRGPGEMARAMTLILLGDVKAEGDVDVGNVKDLVVNLNGGYIAYAIVNREKKLVHENQLSAVPWNLIDYRKTGARPNLLVNLAVEKIQHAPGFSDLYWPDMTQLEWNERTMAYYGSTPHYMIFGYVGAREGFASGPAHTMEGTIQSINRDARGPGLDQPGIQVTLKVDKDEVQQGQGTEGTASEQRLEGQTVLVNLGPAEFLKNKGIELKQGGKLKVTGLVAMRGQPDQPNQQEGQTVIVAREVRMDGKSVILRSNQGRPAWSQ